MATNTAASATTHTGNGSTAAFSISFSYISTAEIDVTVAGTLKTLGTHYTISGATLTFTSGNIPANGAAIKFQRDTDISAKKVDFEDGSVLTEFDLDTNSDQVLFAQQEIIDKLAGIEEGATGDQTAAEIRTLVENASDSNVFTDADHSKLNAIEANATQDQTVSEIKSLIAGSPLDASHLAANSVDSSELVDGSVDTSHLSADCVTNAKIADNSIDSEHYVDGSIDTAHIGNSQVTTAKIADDSITNAKIGAGAVGTTELDTGAITSDKLATNSVTNAKIVNNSITSTKISASAVVTNKIANDAVTNAKIGAGAVGTTELDTNAVTTAKIADAELKTLAGMQSGTASKLADSTALTSDIADLNQLDGMAKQTTITDDDTKFPTSGAVVDYVAAQIAPIGGLEVIANEDSFPTTQPASGVVISISDIEGLIVNGSGVATNARTSGNGSDNVTINGFPSSLQSKTMAAGLGLMVSSTGSSQTYTYHKLLAKEADVEQLSNDINDFAARYRVGSSNPSTDLDAGDLFFNTSTSKLLVYNATNSAWEEAQSIGNFFISTLSPAFDGSTQDFTITNAPANAQQILLSINGVVQKPNSGTSTPSEGFALSGSTVKLAAAPPSGSDYFAIVLGSTVNIGTPSNNTVSTDVLQNGSVTTAKIADSAVTTSKIANANITGAKLAQGSVGTGMIVDDAVTAPKIARLAGNLDFNDNAKAVFGIGNDLQIYHDGTNSIIKESTTAGSLKILGQNILIKNTNDNEVFIDCHANGNVELYYDNVKKLETSSSGAVVSGGFMVDTVAPVADVNTVNHYTYGYFNTGTQQGFTVRGDEAAIEILASDQSHHAGSFVIRGGNEGFGFVNSASADRLELYSFTASGSPFSLHNTGSNVSRRDLCMQINKNGSVELYHDNNKKLETTSVGVNITGNLGLGVTSPTNKIDISGTGNQQIQLVRTDGVGSGGNGFIFKAGSNASSIFTTGGEHTIKLFTNSAEKVVVNSAGHVTKPYHVCFGATGNQGTYAVAAGQTIAFNQKHQSYPNSRHSAYSTSNYRFTAPVTGIYSFTVNLYFRDVNLSNLFSLVPKINGSEVTGGGGDIMFIFSCQNINHDTTISGTVLLELDANDYVEVARRTGQTGSHSLYMPHSSFFGHLIG